MKVLLAGLTARALAESAVAAGCDVATADYFGDLDTKRLGPNVSLRERGSTYSAPALARLARDIACDVVAYTGGFENHPEAVEELARGRELLGNARETLRRVRDPATLFPLLAERGFAVPRTIVVRAGDADQLPMAGRWLVKPLASGGGHGIRQWRGRRPSARHVLQEYVRGTPASAAFVADGRRAVLLGWSEQLHAPARFRYGGNLVPLDASPDALGEVDRLVQALAGCFGLVGLNGVDFVLRDGCPVIVEVNPRYSASMELVERATGAALFALHVAACRSALPDARIGEPALRGVVTHGKAIVYAPRALAVTSSLAWMDRGVRDVPHPGDVIDKGRPICTVFGAAASRSECLAALRAAEEDIVASCAPTDTARSGDA